MADADAVRGAGLIDPVPTGGAPAAPEHAMTLVDHLSELRTRLVRAILAVVVGSAIGFWLAPTIRRILAAPLPAEHRVLQVLGPGDAFAVTLRIAVVFGIILAMPVLLYQLWAFIAPGLTISERKALRPWIPLALFFFALGVAVAWIILPFAIGFLLAFTDETLVANLTAPAYFDFVTTMFLAFGLLMEFPIVLYGLARVGILSSARLSASRRISVLAIAVFAAVATPGGDLISPLVLGGTMYILFELTIFAIRRGGR
ncbi:MAG: sec-independent protein translocase protein TatC [Chloroflexota bacterium]|jgi:sec-independent protein translocase protein TatC|nr:sec-independent protein translocase protein TatC [Chloroflexota bacterium]